jgi:pyruvate,water dikinase
MCWSVISMILFRQLEELTTAELPEVGGKAVALAELARNGRRIPRSLVITADAYHLYQQLTGIGSRISMELGRKNFADMRWEELWDTALRIRNLFLTTPLPQPLETELATALEHQFGSTPLVLRSSAPSEDSAASSFAGLHDSYVNVCERAEQLLAIRKVWASLWSDRALLYRQELGLTVAGSSMAVLVQELIPGEKSGVAFSVAPDNPKQLLVEAVYGLNQGLVDGSIEPDSWHIERDSLQTTEFRAVEKQQKLVPEQGLLKIVPLAEDKQKPVLSEAELARVAQTVLALEQQFSAPQDCEWTWHQEQLVLLQSRPITTVQEEDSRRWYFNLHRSLANLKHLQQRIENEIMPGMEQAAAKLAEVALADISDAELAREFEQRLLLQQMWEDAYRNDCIPMAHGIRLFGEFYNDQLQPKDPFEFLDLLSGGELRAVARNQQLTNLAKRLNQQEKTRELAEEIDRLATATGLAPPQFRTLLTQMAKNSDHQSTPDRTQLEQNYRNHFPVEQWPQAEENLLIGRASYRLRDDDNISLAQLNREVDRAVTELQRRCEAEDKPQLAELLDAFANRQSTLSSPPLAEQKSELRLRARQLQGQPASPGLATAAARVVRTADDLADFKRGEILVCDAIDPTMTFIVPLATGIVERRGGMLIHGAIIAREYHIPCVSGIAAAADIINTGDLLTIDGYLGLVFFPPTSGHLSQPAQEHLLRKELDDAEG